MVDIKTGSSGFPVKKVFTAEAQSSQRGEAATELTVHEAANQRIVEWMSGVHVEGDELTGGGWWSRRVSWKRENLLQQTESRTFL
jgi:hypothetical protein